MTEAELEQSFALTTVAQKYQSEVTRLKSLVFKDSVTGLGNRRAFLERLDTEVHMARSNGWPLALLLVDIDNLKGLNNDHGREIGDQLLTEYGRVIMGHCPPNVFGARLSSDDFAILLPGLTARTTSEFAKHLMEKLQDISLNNITVASNIGIAHLSLLNFIECAASDLIYWAADQALCTAKKRGPNQIAMES